MKSARFSDTQKAYILKQGDDGVPVKEIFRKAGISSATSFNGEMLKDVVRRKLPSLLGVFDL